MASAVGVNLHDKAQVLRKLHHQPQPLVFVNVWDGASARIVESLDFPAIATTSAEEAPSPEPGGASTVVVTLTASMRPRR